MLTINNMAMHTYTCVFKQFMLSQKLKHMDRNAKMLCLDIVNRTEMKLHQAND